MGFDIKKPGTIGRPFYEPHSSVTREAFNRTIVVVVVVVVVVVAVVVVVVVVAVVA